MVDSLTLNPPYKTASVSFEKLVGIYVTNVADVSVSSPRLKGAYPAMPFGRVVGKVSPK